MREITLKQFLQELKSQGVSYRHDFAFRCPICRTIQSARDLIRAGAGTDFDSVEKYLAFSCVGRFTNAGPAPRPLPQDYSGGCDWTLGGLFTLHTLTVVTPDGVKHPRFEPCTAAEAQAHAKQAELALSPQP